MTDTENRSHIAAILKFLKNDPRAADVQPSAVVALAHRIHTHCGPHATDDQCAEYLTEPRKAEQLLFRDTHFSPDARAERLKKMTPEERLAEINKRGGNTK